MVLLRSCSLEVRFEVASKEAGLGLEEKNVQLLVYVSGGASWGYAGSVEAEVPRLVQRYKYGKRSDGGTYYSFLKDFVWLEGLEMPVQGFYPYCSLQVVKCFPGARFVVAVLSQCLEAAFL